MFLKGITTAYFDCKYKITNCECIWPFSSYVHLPFVDIYGGRGYNLILVDQVLEVFQLSLCMRLILYPTEGLSLINPTQNGKSGDS